MDPEQQQFEEPTLYGLEDPLPDEQGHKEPEMLTEPVTQPIEILQQAEVPENQPTAQPDPIQPDLAPAPLRRSTRNRNPVQRLDPMMSGKRHAEVTLPVVKDVSNHTQPDYDFVMFQCMMQLSMKAGLKRFGQQGEEAATKELSQLHLRNTFLPIDWETLTPDARKSMMESHMFLKLKRDGTLKGRTVAGGDKQRGTIDKADASSPTVSLESVLLTSVIDAQERREVATIDIPNAFVQTKLENEEDMAIMRLRGKLAELMVKVAPEVYRKYVFINKKGETILYVKLLNALYEILKAALLFYKKLTKDLITIGFQLNPYDPCVANKTINGKQMTLCWHVDDMKISHYETKKVDQMVTWLRKMYEHLFEDGSGAMKIKRGKVHEYIGMTLDFCVPGEVKVTMLPYVKEIVDDFTKITGDTKTAVTPAADHLFKIDQDAELLSEEMGKVFHNFTAKCLFLTKRARPDILTPVAFCTTRVRKPDQDDWKKLQRMIRYLRGSLELPLILSADGTSIIKWWVNGSHGVHYDMRGHTGGMASLGKGALMPTSTRQKINTRSSTETELVGADDMMPQIMWTNYFMNAQGYGLTQTILYQDNQSAILLEKNGKMSSGKRTKHVNIRYYFIKD
jgi:hypothetical protein